MNTPAHDAFSRIDELLACQQAVADLMTPDGDIQAAQRSNVCILLDFLQRELRLATEQARTAC